MKSTFQMYRYDPDKDAKPYMQTVEIELTGHERMLLDALMKLKEGSTAFSLTSASSSMRSWPSSSISMVCM